MSDTMWVGLVLVIIIVAGFLLLHTRISAAFAVTHAKLDAVKSSGETGVKAAIDDVAAVVTGLHEMFIAHHDNLVPDINVIKQAVTAPQTPIPAPVRPISTDHLDAAPSQGTTNGVPTPAGMTDDSFLHLVLATQGVKGMLSNINVYASLLASSQNWWNAQGPYMREQFLAQTTDPSLRNTFKAFTLAPDALALISITPEQQAAANLAVAGPTK